MSTNQKKMVQSTFRAISEGDAEGAVRYIDPNRFIQHNPRAADGAEGLRSFVLQAPRDQLKLEVVRLLEDGPYVLAQTEGHRSGQNTFFDVFRFENGLVVEHWAFSAPAAPPNQSGHTQLDGPREPSHPEDTEKNKAFTRRYYEAFHLAGDRSRNGEFFGDDLMIRHEPGVKDGLDAFLHDVEHLMRHRTIDAIKLLIGEGDLVFIAAQGTHEGESCAYIDLYRVQNAKLVEHWGFPEMFPPESEWKNSNGLL